MVRIKGENDAKYVEKYLAPSDTQQRLDALVSESGDTFLSTSSRKTPIPLCGSFQFSECLHAHYYLNCCEVLGSRELCMFRSLYFICLLLFHYIVVLFSFFVFFGGGAWAEGGGERES